LVVIRSVSPTKSASDKMGVVFFTLQIKKQQETAV